MKRLLIFIAVLTVVGLIFAGTGCTPEVAEEEEVTEEEVTAEEVTEEEAAEEEVAVEALKVGLSNGQITNTWRTQMINDLQRMFNYYKGLGWVEGDLMVNNAGTDISLQIQQMRNLIDSGVDLIVLNPLSSTALNPVIEEAHDKGIVVTVFDQNVESEFAIQTIPDNAQGMRVMTIFVLDKMGGTGNVVYISGVDGQPNTILRDETVMECLEEYPDVELLAKGNGDWDPAKAQQVMSDFLAAFPQIDGVISQDCMQTGIMAAFEAANRELPPITGDFSMAFLEKWIEMKEESDFESLGAINPPGFTSGYALGVGLRLAQGKELKDGVLTTGPANNIALFEYPLITNDNVEEIYEETLKEFGYVNFIDRIPTQEEIDILFK